MVNTRGSSYYLLCPFWTLKIFLRLQEQVIYHQNSVKNFIRNISIFRCSHFTKKVSYGFVLVDTATSSTLIICIYFLIIYFDIDIRLQKWRKIFYTFVYVPSQFCIPRALYLMAPCWKSLPNFIIFLSSGRGELKSLDFPFPSKFNLDFIKSVLITNFFGWI